MGETMSVDAIAILADRMRTYARVLDLMAAEAAQHARSGDRAAALSVIDTAEHNITTLVALRAAILHIGDEDGSATDAALSAAAAVEATLDHAVR